MLQRALSSWSSSLGRRGVAARREDRRRRNRRTPGAEPLEVRDCPSGASASLGLGESAHAVLAASHAETARSHHVRPARKVSRQAAQTIYVAPKGALGAAAGKTARHPLGSLTLALKRAKAGATIVLAPGVYTQDAGMTGKSNITIVGAANQSSVLAPSSGQALKIYSSSGITIEGVAFRAGGGGIGLAIVGSSVTVQDITTAGNSGTGLVVNGGGTLTATSSHFDSSRSGDGMDVQDGNVTINGCTFNNNGTGGGSAMGSGLSVEGSSQVSVANSQLIGNTNSDLVGYNQAQITAQGSTFSNSQNGDGAIFSNQASVNLTGDTFTSNGTVRGYVSGRNGIEFDQFNGNAVVSGNTFSDNTAMGIFVGGASQPLRITGNTFNSNLIGLFMDASAAPINAVVQSNTFTTTPGSSDQGLVAAGSGVTATIGGSGTSANTFEDFAYSQYANTGGGKSIIRENQSQGATIGYPNLSNMTDNVFLSGGNAVDPLQAIGFCCG